MWYIFILNLFVDINVNIFYKFDQIKIVWLLKNGSCILFGMEEVELKAIWNDRSMWVLTNVISNYQHAGWVETIADYILTEETWVTYFYVYCLVKSM